MLQDFFLGIVQGATEFLPVSSSGHLWLVEHFLGIHENFNLTIALHLATLLAVVVYYYQSIWDIKINSLKYVFSAESRKNKKVTADGILGMQLIVATLVTFVVALSLKDFVTEQISLNLVAGTLIATGILIVIAEKGRPKTETNLNWWMVIGLGLMQGLAVIPGLSRSGLTIAFLVLLGINRQISAKISFLLSIPTILGAGFFMLKDNNWSLPLSGSELLGCAVAFMVALITIHWMTKLINKHWIWFAPYCIGLGLILLIF